MKESPFLKKRKMQDVSFRNVEEFLDFLPAEELVIVEKLRELIFQAIPDCHEKLAYNVPFYKLHANICFIWPASVPWGNMSQQGVRLGFTKGYLLEDEINYLEKGNRKEVYCKDFTNPVEIDDTLILTYLSCAANIDEEVHLQKKNKTS
jgi:hypothetical protein